MKYRTEFQYFVKNVARIPLCNYGRVRRRCEWFVQPLFEVYFRESVQSEQK